jgi:hypothetical protein
MNRRPDGVPADRYQRSKLLSIAARLSSRGFDIRQFFHGDELIELIVTNPEDPDKRRVSVGYDGYVILEYTGQVKDERGADEVVNVIVRLLASGAAEPGQHSADDTPG